MATVLLSYTTSRDTIWSTIGDLLDAVSPQECANFFANAGYDAI